MGLKIEGLISPNELLRKLANVKVGDKLLLNIETEMSEDLQQTVLRGLNRIKRLEGEIRRNVNQLVHDETDKQAIFWDYILSLIHHE